MMPLGFSSITRSSGAVHGSTTENTSSSRILRAMSCVYCDPKSRMTMVDDPCVSTWPVYRWTCDRPDAGYSRGDTGYPPPRHLLRKIFKRRDLGRDQPCKIFIAKYLSVRY